MVKTYHILDLFAGAGGLSLGFELLKKRGIRYKLHRAVEIDKHACETLRKNHGPKKVIEGDITDTETKKRVIEECKGKVQIILGGIPCQSFSLLGPRSGYGRKDRKFKKDKRDRLYQQYLGIVRGLSKDTDVIIIENVRGILSKRDAEGKLIYENIISEFSKLGFSFRTEEGKDYMVLDSADYGVPQHRKRVIFTGVKKKLLEGRKGIPVPKRTHSKKGNNGKQKHVSIWEAIGDLPVVTPKITYTDLNEEEIASARRRNKRRRPGQDVQNYDKKRYRKHVKKVSKAGSVFLSFVRSGSKKIRHHVARSHQLSDIKLFDGMKPGWTARHVFQSGDKKLMSLIKYDMNSFRDKYRRQHPDEPCTTIFAHLSKDGNRFIHPKYARTLTAREAARIQSFPDSFVFSGAMTHKYRQIGNAVPPLLAMKIAGSLSELLQ